MNDPLSLVLPHDAVWAIYEPSARQIVSSLASMDWGAHRAAHVASEAEAYFAKAGDGERSSRPYRMDGDIAVLTLSGPMTKSGSSLSAAGSTTYLSRMVDLAARDTDVKAILLRIDSPGGSVSGTQALSDKIRAAAQRKPVVAVVEDLCASAAYWAASGASTIVANRTAQVGSIGTYMAVADYSRMAANKGIEMHVLSTGKHKGAGVPGAPISDEHLAAWQANVDALNAHFLNAVSTHRGIDLNSLADIADGRVYLAAEALSLGLIDGIGSYDDALSALQEKVNTMNFLDRVRATFSGAATTEAQQAAEQVAKSADQAIEQLSATHAAALAAKEAELQRVRAEQEAAVKAAADAALKVRAEANAAAIAALVADFKITPAVAEAATALRLADATSFDKLFAVVSPIAALAGGGATTTEPNGAKVALDLSAQAEAGARLTEIAQKKMQANGGNYVAAFKAACAENPELAKSHAATLR